MKACCCILLLTLVAGCGKNRQVIRTNDLENWLKYQGEIDVVADSAGVGLANNPTRIQASLYRLKQTVTDYSVEVEFDVNLPTDGPIVEYVGGSGKTKDNAIDQAMDNFLETTMHVIYKAFLNSSDTYQRAESVVINGIPRQMLSGAMVLTTVNGRNQVDLRKMSRKVHDLIIAMRLGSGPHWVKVAYSQVFNKPMPVSSTLDNKDAPDLSSAVQGLEWPQYGEFYTIKQFFVIK